MNIPEYEADKRSSGSDVSSVYVAALQLNSQDNVDENLRVISSLLSKVKSRGANLAVLPENFACMGGDKKSLQIAESISEPGKVIKTLCDEARKNSMWLVAGGMPERHAHMSHKLYNSSLLISPSGAVVSVYRKIHLFDVTFGSSEKAEMYKESETTEAGDEVVVSDVSFGGAGQNVCTKRLGMNICYDLRFPELYRKMGTKGVHLVTLPAAFTVTTGKDHWQVLIRARAIENQVFVIAAAQWGNHLNGRQTYGKSMIVDPWGDVLGTASEGIGYVISELDFSKQDAVRKQLPSLRHIKLDV